MSSETKKQSPSKRLPMDCIGVIVSFFWSSRTFFNIYVLSKEVKWYFDSENLRACENIVFKTARSISRDKFLEGKFLQNLDKETGKSLKFVINLKFGGRGENVLNCLRTNLNFSAAGVLPLTFPKLEYIDYSQENAIHLDYFSKLKNLKKLKLRRDMIINFDNAPMRSSIMNLAHVKDLMICECKSLEDNLFGEKLDLQRWSSWHNGSNPEECEFETLTINGCRNIKGECFKCMKKLVKLSAMYCNLEDFQYLSHVKIMNFAECDLKDDDLKYLVSCERINLTNNKSITNEGLKNLPTSLIEIQICGNTRITASGFSRFKNLETLIKPFYETNLTVDVFVCLPKLKNLIVYAGKNDLEIVHTTNLRSLESLKFVCTGQNFSTLVDDGLLNLRKCFPRLEKLILSGAQLISDDGLKLIVKECPNLRYFEITRNDKITKEVFDRMSVRKKVAKRCKFSIGKYVHIFHNYKINLNIIMSTLPSCMEKNNVCPC